MERGDDVCGAFAKSRGAWVARRATAAGAAAAHVPLKNSQVYAYKQGKVPTSNAADAQTPAARVVSTLCRPTNNKPPLGMALQGFWAADIGLKERLQVQKWQWSCCRV